MKAVPEPRGSMATLGMRSRRRMSSLCQAAACPSSQWLHLTVMAGCRCVKPGIRTSTSCSARATEARSRSAREPLISFSLFISQSLVSVATCSGHCLCVVGSAVVSFVVLHVASRSSNSNHAPVFVRCRLQSWGSKQGFACM